MTEFTVSCPWCSATFTPATTRQKFCQRSCQQNFNRDRADKAPCSECDRPARAKGLCNTHYKAQHPNRASWKKNGDPDVRRAALRRKTQQRRARLKGDVAAERIDRDAIGDRDAWCGQLCQLPVDNTLAWPDPMSASLDHVVPLSLGGKHVQDNVQIAHLYCNTAKGNRVTDFRTPLVA